MTHESRLEALRARLSADGTVQVHRAVLSAEIGSSARTIDCGLKALREAGELEIVTGGRFGAPTVYRLTRHSAPHSAPTPQPQRVTRKRAGHTARHVRRRMPLPPRPTLDRTRHRHAPLVRIRRHQQQRNTRAARRRRVTVRSRRTPHPPREGSLTMPQIIPATPGWYIAIGEKDDPIYEPVIAWQGTTDDRDEEILLPYTDNGRGFPPVRWSTERLLREESQIVYRPRYNPEAES